jgi:hypothetical protein
MTPVLETLIQLNSTPCFDSLAKWDTYYTRHYVLVAEAFHGFTEFHRRENS